MMTTEYFRTVSRILPVVVLAFAAGCGGDSARTANVQGTVTIEGQLAPRGTVTFHPVGDGPVAVGTIHEDGTFALRIGQGNVRSPDHSKIYPGTYVATVEVNALPDRETSIQESGGPPRGGPRLTAIRYASVATSGLIFEVSPGRNVIALDVESSARDSVEDPTEDAESDESHDPGEEVVGQPSEADEDESEDEVETAASDVEGEEGDMP